MRPYSSTVVPRRERLPSASSTACCARVSFDSSRRALEVIFSHYSTSSLLPFAGLASFCKVIVAQPMIEPPMRGPWIEHYRRRSLNKHHSGLSRPVFWRISNHVSTLSHNMHKVNWRQHLSYFHAVRSKIVVAQGINRLHLNATYGVNVPIDESLVRSLYYGERTPHYAEDMSIPVLLSCYFRLRSFSRFLFPSASLLLSHSSLFAPCMMIPQTLRTQGL